MDHLKELGQILKNDLIVSCITERRWFDIKKATPEYFLKFPNKYGWSVGSEGELSPIGRDEDRSTSIFSIGKLLQGWLFFGLIFTVVQKNGRPMLTFDELIDKTPGETNLSTEKLKERLLDWATWEERESAGKYFEALRMRMIRLEVVLETARQVIRHHCDYTEPWDERKKYDPEDQSSKYYMSHKLALTLMVVGETLSQIHRNIMRKVAGYQLQGWNTDSDIGWGQPKYVIDKMVEEEWCPRHVYLLRKQLGDQSILLLHALVSPERTKTIHHHHLDGKCDAQNCLYVHNGSGQSGEYRTAHHRGCNGDGNKSSCVDLRLQGPQMSEVAEILHEAASDVFPLLKLQLNQKRQVSGVRVVRGVGGKHPTKYVTISHVWSHGYGNEAENKVWMCQLRFIKRLLENLNQQEGGDYGSDTPFWMDTLLIPVQGGSEIHEQTKILRKKAIAQIPTIFGYSKCTIVLDRGLLSMSAGITEDELCRTAMKVLASGWMRRLWTLQEAYMSQRLMIAFEEKDAGSILRDFDNLQRKVGELADTLDSVISRKVEGQMKHSIMGLHRPSHPEHNSPTKLMLIADLWRAARLRTTSNPAHEAIALATLLRLQISDNGNGEIANAVSKWTIQQPVPVEKQEKLMCDFWDHVAREYPEAIPPGLIFLPGEKLNTESYGWAPKTFLSAEVIHQPDPLTILQSKSRLKVNGESHRSGLVMECPGYFLYFDHAQTGQLNPGRAKVLSTTVGSEFEFPIDNSFQEWYQVSLPDTPQNNKDYVTLVATRQTQLAVIMSRPSPRTRPPEVGLLVEIYHQSPEEGILYSQILKRILIHRTTKIDKMEHFNDKEPVFGVKVGHNSGQKWCVDGFRSERLRSNDLLLDEPNDDKGALALKTTGPGFQSEKPPKKKASSWGQKLSTLRNSLKG